MSGGHWDYRQQDMFEIAQDIREIVLRNEQGFNGAVIDRLEYASSILVLASAMVQRIDWLLCMDDGEETFLQRWDDDMKSAEKDIAEFRKQLEASNESDD